MPDYKLKGTVCSTSSELDSIHVSCYGNFKPIREIIHD